MKYLSSLALRHTSTLSDYAVLMKPELTLLSVSTAVGSAYIALQGSTHYFLLVHTLLGTILVGGTAGVLNQYIERQYDAMMKRTEHRPIPAGRVQPAEALFFGILLGIAGLSYLAIFTNWVAVSLSVLTLVSYLAIYTPLKRKTPFATVIGGIPGALPPLIGWAIVRGSVSMEAWALFFILFFWQMPHFLSLAWMYRKDYARAGYKLLVVLDQTGDITSRQILIYCCALIPASLMPTLIGFSGYAYFTGAFILSISLLITGIAFFRKQSPLAARRIFYTSLLVLSLLFTLLILA
ncbi:MAG: heme o synthase [Ignavibacteriales bacterium]|nr:heme o synthase [Ignavibacteriales bacterium]